MTTLREIFINNLKYYRKQKGLSQEKLSYAINMSMAYINQIENKASFPQPEIIEKIANVLEIRPVQLFDESGSPANLKAFNKDKYIDEITQKLLSGLSCTITKEIRRILSEEN
jgi:transcriptional regulator with XRE-family HTH domain